MKKHLWKTSLFLLVLSVNAQIAPTTEDKVLSVPLPRIGGLIQFWSYHDSTLYADYNFRIRRAELKAYGTIAPQLKYFLTIDPAKNLKKGLVNQSSDNKILQDIGFSYIPWAEEEVDLELRLGQFKAPNTVESFTSSSSLIFPERSLVTRSYGDKRETGVMLSYERSFFKAYLMGSNGGQTNTNDSSGRKDFTGRLDLNFHKALTLGSFTSVSDSDEGRMNRYGLNAGVDFKGFFLSAEAVTGEELDVKTNGVYADFGYNYQDTFRAGLRYEYIDIRNIVSHLYTAGIRYDLRNIGSAFQLSYTLLNNASSELGTTRSSLDSNGNLLIANFQVSF